MAVRSSSSSDTQASSYKADDQFFGKLFHNRDYLRKNHLEIYAAFVVCEIIDSCCWSDVCTCCEGTVWLIRK